MAGQFAPKGAFLSFSKRFINECPTRPRIGVPPCCAMVPARRATKRKSYKIALFGFCSNIEAPIKALLNRWKCCRLFIDEHATVGIAIESDTEIAAVFATQFLLVGADFLLSKDRLHGGKSAVQFKKSGTSSSQSWRAKKSLRKKPPMPFAASMPILIG